MDCCAAVTVGLSQCGNLYVFACVSMLMWVLGMKQATVQLLSSFACVLL